MRKTAIACLVLGAVSCTPMVMAQGPDGPMGRPMGRGIGGRGIGGPGMGGPGMGGPGPGPERVVTNAPFSAVEVRTFQERLQDGNLISRTSQITRYRDSQGRTRTEETMTRETASGKQSHTRITISDVVAGERHELDSSTMTSHTMKIRTAGSAGAQARTAPPRPDAAAAATHTGRDGSTMTRVELGTQVVNGVAATGRQETEVIPAGRIGNAQAITIVRTVWMSTELKMPVQIKTVDPQHGTSDMEVTNIAMAEPDATLFVVPAGYTEKAAGRGARGADWAGGRPH